jgi:hypothetical protein
MIDIKKLEFIASLSPIATAISISGTGEGAVLRLEIPASEMYSIVQLQLLAGKIFKVTIEEIKDSKYGRKKK